MNDIKDIRAVSVIDSRIDELEASINKLKQEREKLVNAIKSITSRSEETLTSRCDGTEYHGVLMSEYEKELLRDYRVTGDDLKSIQDKAYYYEVWLDCYDYVQFSD